MIKMKTLVIHPSDRSTDFLKIIYEDKDYDVLTDFRNCISIGGKQRLINTMKKYDRIIMMGHGTPSGLLNVVDGRFVGYVIDDNFTKILKEKETISIWCNSDKFFAPRHIKGFHTGMIISEVAEARYVLGYTPLDKEQTLDNMEKFSTIVRDCIEKTPKEMQEYILEKYNFDDDVTRYNRKNIIVLEG